MIDLLFWFSLIIGTLLTSQILSEIEKEEFLRSKTQCGSPESVPEPGPHDLLVDEHVLPGGLNCSIIFLINFI